MGTRSIKEVCIIYRPHSDRSYQVALNTVTWLRRRKINIYTHPTLKPLSGSKKLSTKAQLKNLDLVLVLGGDGTFLRAVQLLQGQPTPVLGVNLGHLGFLTETRVEEIHKVLELALNGKLKRTERTMLTATIVTKSGKKLSYLALNDVVIERGPHARLIDIRISTQDDALVSTVKADGLIVASPTGSTAYSLAAGGPIVHPDVRAMTITPICPHTLTNRPILVPDSTTLHLKLNTQHEGAVVLFDGQRLKELTFDDDLVIHRSKHKVVMLSQPGRAYFDVLRAKLKFGERD